MRGLVASGAFLFLWLSLASAAFAHDGIHQRISRVSRQIAVDSKNAGLFVRRGELHRIHREWASALADYHRARQLDPVLALIDLCLGRMKLDSGKPTSWSGLRPLRDRTPLTVSSWTWPRTG